MSKYHRASVTYSELNSPVTFMLSGIPSPHPRAVYSFGKLLEMEYLDMMQRLDADQNNQMTPAIETRIRWVKGPKISFRDIDGWFYWVPTYRPSVIEVRAFIPKSLYEKAQQDRKTEEMLFEELEKIVDRALDRCKF